MLHLKRKIYVQKRGLYVLKLTGKDTFSMCIPQKLLSF